MNRIWILAALAALMIAACQPTADTPQTLPTLAVLPTLTPTDTSPEVPAQEADTQTPLPAESPAPVTSVPSETADTETADEPEETAAPPPTTTPAPDVTIEIRQEVRFATLTPYPEGVRRQPIRTTPVVMADVVITQGDFQRAIDAALSGSERMQSANVDFRAGGIDVELTALGGTAYVTGRVQFLIQVSGAFATFTIGDVQVNAAEPPEAYLEVVNVELFGLMIEVLDSLLTERVGEGHDLEDIILNDQAMQVYLLVPQR